MKQIVFIASVLLFFVATNFAQSPGVPPPPGEWGRMGGKIEQLEKIKLIEELNLNEETAVRFFARRNEHRESLRSILQKRNALYKELSNEIKLDKKDSLKEKVNEIFLIEDEMVAKRKEFIDSLSDIFTEKQQVQLVLFEFYFRQEMRHQFMKQGKRRMKQMEFD